MVSFELTDDEYYEVIQEINTIITFIFTEILVIGFGFITTFIIMLSNTIFKVWDLIMDKTGRKRVIYDREKNEPYLIRYYILLPDRSSFAPFNIFIHKFLKSDEEPLHNHPWSYFTYILSGGYREHILNPETNECVIYDRKPGFFQKVGADHVHRVELYKTNKCEQSCWTLFIPFKRTQDWGFYVDIDNGDDNGEDNHDDNGVKNKIWVAHTEYKKPKHNHDIELLDLNDHENDHENECENECENKKKED